MGELARRRANWARWIFVLIGAAGVSAAGACGGDDDKKPRGSAGNAGTAGRGGAGGNAGSAGTAGNGGSAGSSGSAGNGGSAGSDAAAGTGGGAGSPADSGTDADAGPFSTYVDCVNGLDTNNGFEATPFKTLAKAASVATSGMTIWVLNGVCDRNTEPTFNEVNGDVDIPAGVSLRAKNPGQVTFSGLTGYRSAGIRFLGSGAVQGIRFQTFGRAIAASSGTLNVTGVTFDDIYQGSPLELSGTAQATLSPGGVTNYVGSDQRTFALLSGTARLTVLGGAIRGAKDSGISGQGMFLVTEQSELVLDGVTLENNQHSGVIVVGSARAIVRNNTTIRNTASGACCNQSSIRVGQTGRLELLDSTITAAPTSAIVLTAGTPNVLLRNATVTNSAGSAILGAIYSDALPTIRIENSRLTDNRGGVYSNYATTLNISGSEISRNGSPSISCAQGISLNPAVINNVTLRNTQVVGNCAAGIIVGGSAGSAFDLGRGNSPGGNTFTGNSSPGNLGNLRIELGGGGTVYASGNTWEPGVQGAALAGSTDPLPGRYKVTTGTALNVTGAQTGRNYAILGASAASTTLRLAENP